MNLQELCSNFKLNLKFIEPLTYMTLNGDTIIYNYDELEDLEYGLVNLLHAISLYKQAEFPNNHCNSLQDVI
jgi:hypothetical protein